MVFSKRGVITLTTLIALALVVILAISFINATGYFTNKEQIKNYYLARDFSQLMNAMEATGYNVEYTYPHTFEDNQLIVKGNKVTATIKETPNNKESSNSITYAESQFLRSSKLTSPSNMVVDCADFSIIKTNNIIQIVNGLLSKEEEKQIKQNNHLVDIKRDELKIKLETKANYLNEEQILNSIRINLENELIDKNFLITDGGENLVLKIIFKDETLNSVYYSSKKQSMTKPLAEDLNKILSTQLSFTPKPLEDDEEYSIPTITIKLSSKEKTIEKLSEEKTEDKGTKQYFVKRIVYVLDNFFQE